MSAITHTVNQEILVVKFFAGIVYPEYFISKTYLTLAVKILSYA